MDCLALLALMTAGLGAHRKLLKGIQVHPRHALDLWNRDNNAVSAFFWDGHVEVLDARKRLFRSPLRNALPIGFDNAMAVQAVFPITIPDEMLGFYGERSNSTLPASHANKLNDLIVSSSYPSQIAQIQSVYEQLLNRLLARKSIAEPWQQKYRGMFHDAYPQKSFSELSIVDLGNALSHFEELAFASADSAFGTGTSVVTPTLSPYRQKSGPSFSMGKAAARHAIRDRCLAISNTMALASSVRFTSAGNT